jgi:hypothetical protein
LAEVKLPIEVFGTTVTDGVRSLSFSPRFPVCFHVETPAAHCHMAAMNLSVLYPVAAKSMIVVLCASRLHDRESRPLIIRPLTVESWPSDRAFRKMAAIKL